MKYNLVITFCFYCLIGANAQIFDVTKFGAIGDGMTLNTEAVQKAVDACNQNRGGTVVISTGVFIIGTVDLKSNVHLYLEAGAVLRGSSNLNDYRPYNLVHYGMLYAGNAENISISGFGNIEGNHSPINNDAYRIFLGNGVHADIDSKIGIGNKIGK